MSRMFRTLIPAQEELGQLRDVGLDVLVDIDQPASLENAHHRRHRDLGHRPEDRSLVGLHTRIVLEDDLPPMQDHHPHVGRVVTAQKLSEGHLPPGHIDRELRDLEHRSVRELTHRPGAVDVDGREDAVEVLVVPGHVPAVDIPPGGVDRQLLDLLGQSP